MADEFKGINQETLKNVEAIKSSMAEIATASAKANKQLTEQSRLLADYRKNYSDIASSAGKFAKLQDEASRSASATGKALKEQQTQLSNVRSLNAQIENLMDQMVSASEEQNKVLKRQVNNLSAARDNAKELADAFGDLVNDSSKLDRSTMWFSALSEVVKDVPGLRKLSGPFEKAAEAARETALSNAKLKATNETIASLGKEALTTGKGLTKEKLKELGLTEQIGNLTGSAAAQALQAFQRNNKTASSGMAGLTAGFKSLGPIIKGALGPLAILQTLVDIGKFFVQSMFEADKRITNIGKNLSISKEAAAGLYENIKAVKVNTDDIRFNTANLTEAFNELAELSEFTNIATKDQLTTQVELTKFLGLQVDSALQLQELFAVNNIESEKGVDLVYDQIAAFANQNKMVANGKKIMTEVAKTSSLIKLNFKGSTSELIKTTLEAKKLGLSLDQVNKVADSLLNFEQSISSELEAELLTGRSINLEKARQAALNNDIAGLTEAIAEQGYDAASFANLNRIQQEAIAKTLGMSASELADSLYKQEVINKTAGNYTKQLREQAAEAKKRKDFETAIKLEKEAAAIEQGVLEGKSLEEAQKRASAEEKFNAALDRAKEIFSDMAKPGGLLDKIVDMLGGLVGASEKGVMYAATGGIEEQSAKSRLEKQGYTVDEGEGLFGTGAFKLTTLKDKEGNVVERAFGSLGIQALEEKYGKSEGVEEADDFIMRPGQPMVKFNKGDIIMGGTNLEGGGGNGELVAAIRELISVVSTDKAIMIDSTKVGTALGLATYNSNVNFNS